MTRIQRRAQTDGVVEAQVVHINAQVVGGAGRDTLGVHARKRCLVDPIGRHRDAVTILHCRIARMAHIARVRDVRTGPRALRLVEHMEVPHDLSPHRLRTTANIDRGLRDLQSTRRTEIGGRSGRVVVRPYSRDCRQQGCRAPVNCLRLSGRIVRVVAIGIEEMPRNTRPTEVQLAQCRQLLEPARVHVAERVIP